MRFNRFECYAHSRRSVVWRWHFNFWRVWRFDSCLWRLLQPITLRWLTACSIRGLRHRWALGIAMLRSCLNFSALEACSHADLVSIGLLHGAGTAPTAARCWVTGLQLGCCHVVSVASSLHCHLGTSWLGDCLTAPDPPASLVVCSATLRGAGLWGRPIIHSQLWLWRCQQPGPRLWRLCRLPVQR